MLITYILCWSRLSGSGPLVGLTSDVVFSSCHNHDELEPSPTGGVFERAQGKPNRKVPKRGKIVPRRGSFPNLVETAGYNLAQAFQEGYLITPHFWSLVHPQCTRKKKNKKRMVGRSPGSTANVVDFDLELIWRRTRTSPSAKRSVPLFVNIWEVVPLFVKWSF